MFNVYVFTLPKINFSWDNLLQISSYGIEVLALANSWRNASWFFSNWDTVFKISYLATINWFKTLSFNLKLKVKASDWLISMETY